MLSKRIILVGKAGSGKDFARKKLESRGYSYAISYTTRPPRDTEVDGVDYIFVTDDQFNKMINNGEFYEYVAFNGWYYGTTIDQFYTDDIFIMTPHGISKVKEIDRKTSFIMYFDIDQDIRKERLMLRNDADKVDRRILADEEDFKDFTDFDIRITNPDF
jgi:guanylate kinase